MINLNQLAITILIDGIHECTDFCKLLLYLRRLFDVTGKGTLKVVLSSRMHVLPPPNFPSQREVIISPNRNSDDIKEYIQVQVFGREQHDNGHRLLRGCNEELEQRVVDTLVARAKGM